MEQMNARCWATVSSTLLPGVVVPARRVTQRQNQGELFGRRATGEIVSGITAQERDAATEVALQLRLL
jgi:hypothetical protein